jgi:hypothetical protein
MHTMPVLDASAFKGQRQRQDGEFRLTEPSVGDVWRSARRPEELRAQSSCYNRGLMRGVHVE